MSKVVLISSEGEEYEVDEKVACKSNLIKNIIEDTGIDDKIPLPNLKSNTLKKVLEYCEMHKNNDPSEIEKPLKTNNLAELVEPADYSFINMPNLEDIFDIILAANYLDIKSLLDLSCAKIASIMKGKTADEIRTIFNIQNDFTPEEEAEIREQNKWASELY